jgi:hypothetical protein
MSKPVAIITGYLKIENIVSYYTPFSMVKLNLKHPLAENKYKANPPV